MKKTLTTMTLAATMFFGATFANAGIIIGDLREDKPCTVKVDSGIIIGDVGIIIGDLVGIIIGDLKDDSCKAETKTNVGIIIGD